MIHSTGITNAQSARWKRQSEETENHHTGGYMKKLYINPHDYISFSEKTVSLSDELATRKRSIDFYALGMYLPNPDPVLKKQGKDITVYKRASLRCTPGRMYIEQKGGVKSLEWEIDRGTAKSRQQNSWKIPSKISI
jgi:hypothetical protein